MALIKDAESSWGCIWMFFYSFSSAQKGVQQGSIQGPTWFCLSHVSTHTRSSRWLPPTTLNFILFFQVVRFPLRIVPCVWEGENMFKMQPYYFSMTLQPLVSLLFFIIMFNLGLCSEWLRNITSQMNVLFTSHLEAVLCQLLLLDTDR